MADEAPLLEVRDLTVEFTVPGGVLRAVDGISFQMFAGRSLGIVGESGSGKSVAALSIMRLLTGENVRLDATALRYRDVDLLAASSATLRQLRGSEISMVFQEPMSSLNPVLTIGDQVTEARRAHAMPTSRDVAVELLAGVDINEPERRVRQYPHNLSGGMRQRVMIATALSCDPRLLILDEPTTALDVTVQAQILDLVRAKVRDTGTSLLLITHDLGVVAEMVDDIAVMYAGRIVEAGPVERVLGRPQHPYTRALLAAMPANNVVGRPLRTLRGGVPSVGEHRRGCNFQPRCPVSTERCLTDDPRLGDEGLEVACWNVSAAARAAEADRRMPSPKGGEQDGPPLLRVRDLRKLYAVRSAQRGGSSELWAVDGVSFDLALGEVLGVVGESGCGKTTLSKMLVGLEQPSSGTIEFEGSDLRSIGRRGADARRMRRNVQFIFQDPYGSLNPRMTVGTILAESLRANAGDGNDWSKSSVREGVIAKVLEDVGLGRRASIKYPHEFSGGQRQRIAIARALVMRPKLIVCDEPVSALDVSVQGQILNLLTELRAEYAMALVFIAHDLAVIEHVSDRIAVMYLGRMVEIGSRDDLAKTPRHPYTVALLSAAPRVGEAAERERIVLQGELPAPTDPPSGCRFHTRCWLRSELGDPPRCAEVDPALEPCSATHASACHFVDEVASRGPGVKAVPHAG